MRTFRPVSLRRTVPNPLYAVGAYRMQGSLQALYVQRYIKIVAYTVHMHRFISPAALVQKTSNCMWKYLRTALSKL